MLQKNAKLIFISSVNSADQATSFLYRLRNASEKMLNVVNYVCPDHREDFNLQESLVSCPCYRLHIPTYITIDESVKNITNLFLEGAFTTELMGDSSITSKSNMHKVIGELALTQFDLCRIETTKPPVSESINGTLYVYIDPAYTNNSDASGTGIGALVNLKNCSGKSIILGLEHFFLKNLTGAATLQIATCACVLIRSVVTLHPQITKVHVAVEGNSNQDSAVAIATFLHESCPIPIYFLHCSDKNTSLQWPIYLLGGEKSQAFEEFIYAMNAGTISASQTTVSNTIKLSYDPINYFLEQVKAIKSYPLKDGSQTYCAKQKHMSDDVLIAIVMAHYFLKSEKHTFKNLQTHN